MTLMNELTLCALRNLKIIAAIAPNGPLLTKMLWKQQGLINCCTTIWMDNWPPDGFKDVAKKNLSYNPKSEEELKALDPKATFEKRRRADENAEPRQVITD